MKIPSGSIDFTRAAAEGRNTLGGHQAAGIDLAQAKSLQNAGSAPSGDDAARLKAARDFEQIFLRKMLSSLEKTSKPQGGSVTSGGDVYSSMVVGALADAISAAGGIGLADMIAKSAAPAASAPKSPVSTAVGITTPAPVPATLAGSKGDDVGSLTTDERSPKGPSVERVLGK